MYSLLGLIVLIAIIETLAQSCVKHGHTINNHNYFYLGGMCHIAVGIVLFYIYSHDKGISYCNLLWSIVSILFASLIGRFFFKEKINYMACSLVLIALLIIAYDEMK